jgi:hypothetical protein
MAMVGAMVAPPLPNSRCCRRVRFPSWSYAPAVRLASQPPCTARRTDEAPSFCASTFGPGSCRIEVLGEGSDTVEVAIAASVSSVLPDDRENGMTTADRAADCEPRRIDRTAVGADIRVFYR